MLRTEAKAEDRTKDPLLTRLYHFYSLNLDWFEKHYHKGSNVMWRAHAHWTKTAMVNEVPRKILLSYFDGNGDAAVPKAYFSAFFFGKQTDA